VNNLLKTAFITSIIVSILLGAFLLFSNYSNLPFFIFNFLTTFSFYVVLIASYRKITHNYLGLITTTVIYQTIAITALTQLYISYTGHPFSLMARDSLTYDWLATENINLPFLDAVKAIASELAIDDLGFPTYLSFAYRLSLNPLLARYFLIIVIILISIFVYKIGQNYLSNRYAYLASIAVSISNFSVLYASNGTKELFMILILMASFHYFLRYMKRREIKYLIVAVLVSFLLIFFRIPMVFFFLMTIAISFLFHKGNKSVFVVFLSIVIFSSIFLLYNYYSRSIDRFADISTEDAVERSAGFVGHSGLFTFFVSIVSGVIGPLPTLFPKLGKEDISFIGAAVVLRVFLAGYIISTVYYVYKNRESKFYPIIIYPLITISALLVISEVFEFRFHLPHVPLLIILGFYGIENGLLKGKKLLYINVILVLIIIYWNFGRAY